MLVRLTIAILIFSIALEGGGYSVESRAVIAIASWWAIILGLLFGLWPVKRFSRPAVAGGALLAAFAAFTGTSIAWAPSAENAFDEFNRVTLYLGVFLIAALTAKHRSTSLWTDGLGIGVAAVGLLALASRLFPTVLPAGDVPEFLPSAATRLSYPVEYWNGLAILVALAFPLLLRASVAAERPLWRVIALAPLPALAATIYLTSSRGGVATGVTGLITFLALTARRSAAIAAVTVAALGSVVSIGALLLRDELVNDPFGSPTVPAQGRSAALIIALACAGVALAYALGTRYAGAVRVPSWAGQAPSWARHAAAVTAVAAALLGIAASDPIERFETFKQPPGEIADTEDDFVRAHLLSGNGSGRWQFWTAAAEEFQQHPLLGNGAGSYEAWWARHGTIAMFVRDAHSLYVEALGELGVMGLLLVTSAFALGLVKGIQRVRASEGEERVTAAALLACFAAYVLAVGIDWMWELTVVSIVGITCLGLLTGSATAVAPLPRAAPGTTERSRARFALGLAVLTLGWLVVSAQAIPLLTQVKIADSQSAVGRADADAALADATAARHLQPWAASPYLQLSLVEEQRGDVAAARTWIEEAIRRDAENWRLWLVAARLETKAGAIADARRSIARAAELNPRSPLFAEVSS